MKLFVSFFMVFLLMLGTAIAKDEVKPTEVMVDTKESKVEWVGRKVTGQHNGMIDIKMGKLQMDAGSLKGGYFVMDMTSMINLDLEDPGYNKKLMDHLKSDDFFSVASHPTSEFTITNISKEGENKYRVRGDLTIKEITHPIEFPAVIEMKDGKMMATAEITVDRAKYDVRYGSGSFFKGLGDKLIYDDFTLKVHLVASK